MHRGSRPFSGGRGGGGGVRGGGVGRGQSGHGHGQGQGQGYSGSGVVLTARGFDFLLGGSASDFCLRFVRARAERPVSTTLLGEDAGSVSFEVENVAQALSVKKLSGIRYYRQKITVTMDSEGQSQSPSQSLSHSQNQNQNQSRSQNARPAGHGETIHLLAQLVEARFNPHAAFLDLENLEADPTFAQTGLDGFRNSSSGFGAVLMKLVAIKCPNVCCHCHNVALRFGNTDAHTHTHMSFYNTLNLPHIHSYSFILLHTNTYTNTYTHTYTHTFTHIYTPNLHNPLNVRTPAHTQVQTISFARNNIRSTDQISSLAQHLPNLANLSLQDNAISSFRDLEGLKGKELPALKELILSGNPLVKKELARGAEAKYRSTVKSMFPSIHMLDMAPVVDEISFDLDDTESQRLPVDIQHNFFDNNVTQATAGQFLNQYYTTFDNARPALLDLYDPAALFSLQVNQNNAPWARNSRREQFLSWLDLNRNHSRVAKDEKREALLITGNNDILRVLSDLPGTKHPVADPMKFSVDAYVMLEYSVPGPMNVERRPVMFISVHGEFSQGAS